MLLTHVFKFALIKDDIIKNPVMGASMPSISQFDKKEIRYFNSAEIKAFKEGSYKKI